MRKLTVLVSVAVTAMALGAFSIGFSLAYLSDADTAGATTAAAGYLDVDVQLELTGYGVPSDTLLNKYGHWMGPDKSKVTVTNNSLIPVEYTLTLTVDPETAKLLENVDGLTLENESNQPLTLTKTTGGGNDPTVYVFENLKLDAAAPGLTGPTPTTEEFGLKLKFKGEDMGVENGVRKTDGNDFQRHPIKVKATVFAEQVGGGA